MSANYPVILDGVAKGNLVVTREGLITRFEARCEDPGRLVRLSVYGGGREGYLGVMAPGNGALSLCKRISRAGLQGFPDVIEFAGEAGQKQAASPVEMPACEAPEPRPAPPPAPQPAKRRGPSTIPNLVPRRGGAVRKQPEKKKEESDDLLWYRAGDGTLFTTWQGRQFRAFPPASYGLPMEKMLEKRTIEGIEYAVFETRDGKISG